MHYRFLSSIAAVIMFGLPIIVQAEKSSNVNKFYETRRGQIEQDAEKDFKNLAEKYRKALKEAKSHFMSKGNLVNTMAANKELKRFNDKGTPCHNIPDTIDKRLAGLLKHFRNKWETIKNNERRRLIAINRKYLNYLKDKEKKLTRNDKLDQAVSVHKKIQKLETHTEQLKSALSKAEKAAQERSARPAAKNNQSPIQKIPQSLRESLIAYYTFNEKSKQPKDLSKNDFHGRLKGGAVINNQNLHLKKKGQYMNTGIKPDIFTGQQSFTVALWIKTMSKKAALVSNTFAPTSLFRISQGRGTDSDGIQFGLRTSKSGWCHVEEDSVLDLDKWNHVVGTFDGEEITIFVNGDKKESADAQGRITSKGPALTVKIGAAGTGRHQYFKGRIDDVVLLNCALTDEQAEELYNNTKH